MPRRKIISKSGLQLGPLHIGVLALLLIGAVVAYFKYLRPMGMGMGVTP